MYFEEGVAKTVADIISDVCKIAGVELDRKQCVAEVTSPEGTDITKRVEFKFKDTDITVQIQMLNTDGTDNTCFVSIFRESADEDYMADEIESYDVDELRKKMKDVAVDNGVIISDELKVEIAEFIECNEYSWEGTISYKL
jgi:hypothetical protein